MASLARSLARNLTIEDGDVFVGSRSTINFVAGAGIDIVATDDPIANEVDVAISATGGGGGEVNTLQKIATATGTDITAAKLGVALQVKGLLAGAGISTTIAADDVVVASTGAILSQEWWGGEFEIPNNSSWAVNAIAPAQADGHTNSNTVHAFDDIIVEGVGFRMKLRTGATTLSLEIDSRAETAPAGARTVGLRLQARQYPDNAAVTGWSAGLVLANIDIPTNNNMQYDTQLNITLASIGAVAGQLNQFELTRIAPSVGTNLVDDWWLSRLRVTTN